jgi:NTE family protein/lysophospholipid hydrolase
MDKTNSQGSGMDLVGLLGATTAIFGALEEADLRTLASELEWVQIPGGEILIRQGDPGDSMFVVITGRFQVSVKLDGGKEEVLGEIGRGELVGEMAILTGEHRFATVRAIRDSGLVKLSKEAFERIVPQNPRAAMLIARRLVTRLKSQGQAKAIRTLSTVGVIAASHAAPLADFSTRLAASLGKLGPTRHLNSSTLESEFGKGTATSTDDATKSRIGAWLDQQESQFKYVIYEADPTPSPWTDLCVRQADRILLVADSTAEPVFGAAASHSLSHAAAQQELVLLHQDRSGAPKDTRRWLEAGKLTAHHHLGVATTSDYDRLARLLTGRAVGLVLGGGGARGLAHIGVIRAFQEAGVPIDMIGGTSMGAVIAAQYAMGCDIPTMVEMNRNGWIKMDPLKDKTLPIVALLSGKKLDRMLNMMFGDARIEDLWVKYFCVAANLTQAETVIHESGPLKTAVRASMAIPGVAPALCNHGDLIVDGGVLNNLPADVMRNLSGGKVIAVDVSPRRDLAVDPSYCELPSAWQILWSRINPLAKPMNVPSILAIMMRTLMLSSAHSANVEMKKVDLCLSPPIDAFGLFDWHHIDKIVDAGYQDARKKIEEWKAAQPELPVPRPLGGEGGPQGGGGPA